MKKPLSILAVIVFLTLILQPGYAQGNTSKKAKSLKWIPENGFWVIEGNVKTPRLSTICFYNKERTLVYKEQMEGIRMNLRRKKVLLRLRNVLDQSIIAWETHHVAKENQMLVASMFKRY